jgi:hypothetical protein
MIIGVAERIVNRHRAIKKKIKNREKVIELMANLPPSISDDFWLNWFIEPELLYLKYLKGLRVVPGKLMTRSRIKKRIDKAYDDAVVSLLSEVETTTPGNVTIKEVTLPLVREASYVNSAFRMATDGLWSYIFNHIEEASEVLYYTLMDCVSEGPYEYKEIQLTEGDIVIDAGANIGAFSALAAMGGLQSICL